ncbi:MAG: dTDP-4-dehydrorhamnose reductase, dTDP-4-dehydrorhamnose reductase [Candidatus Peregrinibacteria bacterium GW2011_GWF2_33_10]|nr:MAG: dTDP-4-dehydrorhamnose reductase, dTDP-4-dehydrorhamnose reductase [Candidatus Peregrinibacteria bacterium GW2011_GWF2_33_10]OGJ44336.1 MAG: dTDP-4-dehydrorhamnose reductase [Candidatus Peregrinibacteria bacterium RIFOXYA12_FULL_33_12]OGJ44464.1 MAG: dTDP-4-dehydrorhamnose reductase [Candidatus Peregrinibacteria bacterium RIFOXYA2_FULL_33_21]OGJ50214.1 MAG: dTDP-4-dehydrorhamnose reductase [Candidatus Peregrinibacteria bacterium RIFOXYB2_FULL_33_20]
MKILIIGSSGQLGKCATEILSKKHEIKTSAIDIPSDFKYDLTNDNLEKTLGEYKPDIILLAAAYTHVDGCEQNPELSYSINYKGTVNVADYCKKFDTKLIFLSTDYVFDGENGPYNEDDKTNPLNVYGQHKLDSEIYIKNNLKNYLILRTAWLADTKYDDKNYVAQVLKKLKNNETVKAVDDQFGNPTLTRNLVKNMETLLEKNISGLYHLCGTATIDRFTYTQKIANIFGFDKNLVLKAKSSDFPSTAKRPRHGGLNTSKIQKNSGIKLLNVKEMLEIMKK